MFKILKGWVNSLQSKIEKKLEDIARENEKTYGKGRLDCCQLNRPSEKQIK